MQFGQPLKLTIERIGQRLTTYADGERVGHITVPGIELSTRTEDPHRPLVGLLTACSHCEAQLEMLRIEVPVDSPAPIDRTACSNRIRNGSFTHATDGIPDGWALTT